MIHYGTLVSIAIDPSKTKFHSHPISIPLLFLVLKTLKVPPIYTNRPLFLHLDANYISIAMLHAKIVIICQGESKGVLLYDSSIDKRCCGKV